MYNDMQYSSNLATTVRISDETKKLLVRIRSEISYKDGIDRSMEEIILYLIENYNKTKEQESSFGQPPAGPSYKK